MRYCLLILLALVPIFSIPTEATNSSPSSVILLVNRLTLDDIVATQLPNLSQAMKSSGMGLLNLRTSGGYGPEKILLGISAGSPAIANTIGEIFLDSTEEYYRSSGKILYQRLFGALPNGVINNPFYGSIIQQNLTSEFPNQIGALGTMIHQKGMKTGLWGQSDPDTYMVNRSAGLIIADEKGQIDLGWVDDSITISDPSFPSGRRINGEALWDSYQDVADKLSLTVIDWGELDILDYWSGMVPPDRNAVLRTETFQRLDQLFQKFHRDTMIRGQKLIVLSAAPPRATPPTQRLGLVIIFDPQFRPGLLQSVTTKTAGMITPYDLHHYLVNRLELPGVGTAIGGSIHTKPGNVTGLHGFYRRLLRTESHRAPILLILIYLTSFGLIVGGILVFMGQARGRAVWSVQWILKLTMNLPMAMLLLPLLKPMNLSAHILGVFSLSFLSATLIHYKYRHNAKEIALISVLTTFVVLFDALFRGLLSQYSVLGYSLITGARYYGLGNEFTGIVMGSLLLVSGFYLHYFGRFLRNLWVISIFFLISLTLITFPFFGANIGDVIPIFTFLGVTLLLYWNRPISLRRLLYIGGFVSLLLIVFAFYDSMRSNPTHLGQLVHRIAQNGWHSACMMIQRKLAMNWKLIKYSRWTTVVLIVLILFPLTLRHPRGPLLRVFKHYPTLRSSYIGIALAGLGGFLFNDSGIVAAATTYLIPSLAMLLLMLETMDTSIPACSVHTQP